jgi:hypothetical protein
VKGIENYSVRNCKGLGRERIVSSLRSLALGLQGSSSVIVTDFSINNNYNFCFSIFGFLARSIRN